MPYLLYMYRASRIILNLDTEEIELQGRVEGAIEVQDDKAAQNDQTEQDSQGQAAPAGDAQ